jgi:hypothetical protein
VNSAQRDRQKRGAALIVVLAFVLLLTGLVVAYLSHTSTDRQLAHATFSENRADIIARGALDTLVADFRQEITNGSPITTANIGPQRSPQPVAGSTAVIPNLLRRSVRSDSIPFPAIGSRASSVNSTGDISLNRRSVSLARWNSHYLAPKANTSDNAADPVTTGFASPNYWAPDWVLLTRSGPAAYNTWDPLLSDATSQSYAVGRYAYVVYDEGGLLDANIVGLPFPAPAVTDIGRKGTVALADLTAMKLTSGGATPNPTTISKIVAWRNYATLQSSGTFPTLSPTPVPSAFLNYFLDTARDFRTVANTIYSNRTDQAFVTRRELIELVGSSISASFNMLQFLGTFSRESNIPTWKPTGSTANLTQRFCMGNLALVKAASTNADIQKYFGLIWASGNDTVAPKIPGHWQYVGSTGRTLRTNISAFTTNPDFFQLLNYGLNSTNADDTTHISSTLAIGAAIIDQYDDDTSADPLTGTTTSMIEYGGGWAVGMENVDPARSPTPAPAGMSPTPAPTPTVGYVMLNRPFRNVGEFGYAFKQSSSRPDQTIDFCTSTSTDAPILDLFTYNTAAVRAGIVNLNTQNPAVIASLIKGAISSEVASSVVGLAASNNAAASPTPNPTKGVIGSTVSGSEGTSVKPALSRADVTRLAAAAGAALGTTDEAMETVTRALAEVGQTRTWNLMIDLIAQSGKYPSTATSLANFAVEAEKRYWLHIAIDRFTGEVIDQQLEAVYE